eukprot:126092-Pelagomonas_calceolata.AAC.7
MQLFVILGSAANDLMHAMDQKLDTAGWKISIIIPVSLLSLVALKVSALSDQMSAEEALNLHCYEKG